MLVRTYDAGHDTTVLLLRYPACPDEELFPFDSTSIVPSQEAQDRFRQDLQVLAEHGLVHPFARGTAHWLISSKTGTLLLDSWYCLRRGEPEEAQDLLRRVDRRLEKRAAEAAQAHESPSANPTAAPDAPTLRTRLTGSAGAPPELPSAGSAPSSTSPADFGAPRNRLLEVFGRPRVFLPVIHPIGWEPALAAVRCVAEAGVPGVFLINQGLSAEDVLRLVMAVRERHPALWVGVNLLGYSPVQALEAALAACDGRLDGLWTDNAGINEAAPEQAAGRLFVAARQRLRWTGLYFGGVAFKYQREVAAADLPAAARAAAPYLDVLCTSGPGTGHAADPDKISTLHRAAGEHLPIALASGVTVDNIATYLPHASAFLVGTGIEHSLGVPDPVRVTALQHTISSYRPR
ncbi:MAG: hypothetical protein IPI49_13030 [Myxococcales bacterium]|nr:hypothetical protein [Myxococcales bacterium]